MVPGLIALRQYRDFAVLPEPGILPDPFRVLDTAITALGFTVPD